MCHTYHINACMTPAVCHELRIAFVVCIITIHQLIFCLFPKFTCLLSPCRPETWREICPSEAEEDRQETMDQLSSYLVCLYSLCTCLEVTPKHMCISHYQAVHISTHSALDLSMDSLCTVLAVFIVTLVMQAFACPAGHCGDTLVARYCSTL